MHTCSTSSFSVEVLMDPARTNDQFNWYGGAFSNPTVVLYQMILLKLVAVGNPSCAEEIPPTADKDNECDECVTGSNSSYNYHLKILSSQKQSIIC